MIQRKQTLFLLELLFLGVALLFVPGSTIVTTEGTSSISLLPLGGGFMSTSGHYAAIALNILGLLLALLTVFMYRKRSLQVRLCYVLALLWLVLGLMTAFCPFVVWTEGITDVQQNYSGIIISGFAIAAALLAARFINKDIELLKSADRIR